MIQPQNRIGYAHNWPDLVWHGRVGFGLMLLKTSPWGILTISAKVPVAKTRKGGRTLTLFLYKSRYNRGLGPLLILTLFLALFCVSVVIRWFILYFSGDWVFSKLTTRRLLSHGSTMTLWPNRFLCWFESAGFVLNSIYWKPFLLWVHPLQDSINADDSTLPYISLRLNNSIPTFQGTCHWMTS